MAGAHVVLYRKLSTRRGPRARAVLLIKRTQDAPSHPGHWGLVGGTLEPGETPRRGLLREIGEELAHGSPIRLQPLWRTANLTYYRAYLPEDMDSLRLKRGKADRKVEGEGLSWFTQAEVRRLRMRREDRIAVQKVFSLRS
jgi:ADP-ribose pyrophosphatase YjhB (NUDIX family)